MHFFNRIIMDECGKLERDAFVFQQAVMGALDGSVTILGVEKNNRSGLDRSNQKTSESAATHCYREKP